MKLIETFYNNYAIDTMEYEEIPEYCKDELIENLCKAVLLEVRNKSYFDHVLILESKIVKNYENVTIQVRCQVYKKEE